jgi:uncharacterized small protein (DUF1192 family)
MAKALLGHVGSPDIRLLSEVRRLQDRVRELESEVLRLHAENDALAASVSHTDLISLEAVKEPALA